jgi:aryl-alcohol dehydrogenase-like predicted oxidoreductase
MDSLVIERKRSMRTVTAGGHAFSIMSLGTVQLGLNYGISNTSGKPDEKKAFEILGCAVDNGVNTLDTAAAYGESEEVIGRWLKTIKPADRPFVVTKAVSLDHRSGPALRKSLRESVERSKKRLGMERLDLLMLHHFDEYLCMPDEVRRAMQELKDNGDIRFTGVSAYSFHDYKQVAASGFDAAQIPVNIFDWGQIENGGLKKLHESGMMVFVRSVYLQGLIFRNPQKLEPAMQFAKPTLEKFYALCEKYQLAPAAMALSYALSLPGITSLVLGSETPEQVLQNVRLLKNAPLLSDAQMAEIREQFLDTPARVFDPRMWPAQ